MQQTPNVTPLDTRKRSRESTEAATQNISSVTGHQAESKKARQCKGIAWRESLEDIKHIHRASYPVDFWSACSPWSIVKAQLTAACDTQRQFLAKLMHPASPSCNASDNIDANPAKRRQQYLTAAVSILSALGMDTTALDKTAASESDTSATARRIAILQAVLESIETGVPGMSSSQPSASSSSFHAVETTRDPAPSDASPSTAAQPECDDDGHDLSPVLFSMNGSRAAQSRNASASSHVDSYVSFLDALDEDDNDTPEGARHQPAFGSLRSSDKRAPVTHSGRAVPSRAGDVSTPSPPAAHEEASGAVPCIQRQTVLCAAKNKAGPKPLTVFTSLSSSPDSLCSKDRQLSPRALRVGSV